MPEFKDEELSMLAGFVCERYDSLMEIYEDKNPKLLSEYRNGAYKVAVSLVSLNEKLRPYYVKGKYR